MIDLMIEGKVRKDIIDAAYGAGDIGAHIAPSMSIVEITLSIIKMMNPEKDVIVLSKGHGGLGLYSAMHQMGYMTSALFETFEKNGGDLPGQPSRSETNGIVFSSGSLGMGLTYAAGRAIANAKKGGMVYVILGDGECNEGSIWEAALFAGHNNLNNLIAVVDKNEMQSDGKTAKILDMNLTALWKDCNWECIECDGHSIAEIENSILEGTMESSKPLVVIAHTVKGKGVSFMENNNMWHHAVLDKEKYKEAIAEIEEKYGLS